MQTGTPADQSVAALTQHEILGNAIWQWALALCVGAVTLIALLIAKRLLIARVCRIGETGHGAAFNVGLRLLKGLTWTPILAAVLVLSTRALDLPPRIDTMIRIIVVLAIAIQTARWAIVLVDFGLEEFMRRHTDKAGQPDAGLQTALAPGKFLLRLLAFASIALLALENMGVDVTAMIAGVGIGGIAIALAVQNILGDLFGSLSIAIDKPFVVGDFIVVGAHMGTVEHIGVKSTRIRSLSGEQLVFTNTDLLSSRIQNFKRMQERRVIFSLGVVYRTDAETLEGIPAIIREAIELQAPNVRFDRAHFKQFGPSSLDFEAVYWVLNPDYNTYMDIQQQINLAILRRFALQGIEFAYPTQTLYLQNVPAA